MEKRYRAKSIDECVKNAITDLGVLEEEIDYEVVQEPSRGFFGLGAKEAEISVKLNDTYNINLIKYFFSTLMGYYAMEYTLDVEVIRTMGVYSAKLRSKEPFSELIGKHGHTLNAIQHLVSVYLNKKNDHHVSVFVDVNGYKERKEEFIKRIAQSAALKVKRGGKKVSLDPMSSRERKIVHEVLSHFKDIHSYSVGVEPYRYVVIEKARVSAKR